MKVRIEIDTKTFVRFWLVVIGFAFVILALYSARQALVVIGVAFFLTLALNAPVASVARRLPGRSRLLATAIAFVLVVTALGLLLFLMAPPIIQQTVKLVQNLPDLVEQITDSSSGVGGLIDRYNLQPQIDRAVESFRNTTGEWVSSIGRNAISGISSVFSFVGTSLLTLVMTFLMLVEGPQWMKRIWGIYGDEDRMHHHKDLAGKMYSVVSSYVNGQLAVSGIDAVLAGAVVFLLSLFTPVSGELALPTVAIAFLFSLIPMFGATIAGVLITILLLFNSFTAAIIFVVYFIVYQQVENNVIMPNIQSKTLDLSPLAVLVAATIGLYIFGLAGGIIAIPIAGAIRILIEDYLAHAKKRRKMSRHPLGRLARKISDQ